jgi:hypothetical protein
MAKPRSKKKESYRDRWLREHPRICLYLNRDEYEALKRVAESKKMSFKDIVLDAVHNIKKYYDTGYDHGWRDAFELFLEDPHAFYSELEYLFPNANVEEVALFTAPCSICGKPMIFTHKNSNWVKEVRPTLYEAFSNWYHVCCKEVEEGKRKSCTHLPRGLG